jgi:hypothetical protein
MLSNNNKNNGKLSGHEADELTTWRRVVLESTEEIP